MKMQFSLQEFIYQVFWCWIAEHKKNLLYAAWLCLLFRVIRYKNIHTTNLDSMALFK